MEYKKNILVFGTGSHFLKNKEKIDVKYNTLAFLDNSLDKVGKEFFLKKIVKPENYKLYDFDHILVASSFECEIVEQLLRLGVQKEKIILLEFFLNFSESNILSHRKASRLFHPSVGCDGSNLSIIILSFNRSDMTIRLLSSIVSKLTNFAGEIIVFDNGSDKDELLAIKEYISCCVFENIILVESDTNFGVARARNIATGYSYKDWLFFIDNDIYFTSNPLPTIHEIIENHGALYINLPLLNKDRISVYAYGGSIVYDDTSNLVRIESFFTMNSTKEYVETLVNERVIFGSFVYGGTSVYHKDSFKSVGMFDDKMFIGFEDVDFSIRLLQCGVKIANAPVFCMVHDHARAEDKDYNNVRYDREIIINSANVFFEKHKHQVYSDDIDEWLQECKLV